MALKQGPFNRVAARMGRMRLGKQIMYRAKMFGETQMMPRTRINRKKKKKKK